MEKVSICREHTKCRVCKSTDLTNYLNLGKLPISNNLGNSEHDAISVDKYPLQVLFCNSCGLSQLSVVIDPKELFCYYTYVSGVNNGYVKHCRKMAIDLKERFGLTNTSFMIDIGSNDGTLLQQFKEEIGLEVLGVDPSKNITEVARQKGIPSITDFWGLPILYTVGKRADLITATNVFAHLDNLDEFIVACRGMMKQDSILVIENPYLKDFVGNMEWDTIYFEHLTYWSLLPMIKLCEKYELKVIAAEKQDIHGGSMRYIITRKESKYPISPEIEQICADEVINWFDKPDTYFTWANKVKYFISVFSTNLFKLKNQNKTIIGFAASAKGNTLLNCACINKTIVDCIIDETPEKINKFSPGTGIPIIGIENVMKINPDYILILSWNFKVEIMEKIKKLGYAGKFIIPIPEWQII